MPLDRQFGIRPRHALAIVFDDEHLLAAELDGDTAAVRAVIAGILDQFLDDGCRSLNDLTGGNLIGQRRRQALNPIHSHFIRLNAISITTMIVSMTPATHQNCTGSPPGSAGNATFMPHIPVRTVNGMKIVEITVRTFIT